MALPLHYHLVQSIAEALEEIFFEKKYADKVIEKCFKNNRKWGSRDRKFFAETVYEIVRHKRRLEFVVGSDHPWDLIAAYLFQTMNEIPDWEEFDHLKISDLKSKNSAEKSPEVANSFPDWLNDLGKNEFAGEWTKIMNALNMPAEVFLRTNTIKTNADNLIAELAAEDIQASIVFDSCVKLTKRKNVFITQAFKKGYFEVQDAASQMVAPLLDLKPGLRVADTCAGAGGKSLHLAALMKNKGKIIAMDIHEWKLKALKVRAARDGVDIIETKLIESNKTIKRLENTFDRVLLDVPCSGLGVLRRNPDTKWKLSLEEIARLTDLQKEIISQYSKLCKSSGIMVYATCSILHRENEEQVQWFLNSEAGKNWTLKKEMRVWPHIDKYDGFYAAVMVKS
ncbi:MAG: RsmB/NOP family class I SAM-dependent RNA methyltransferase [Bdellovibrionota bacterium]